ncbi:hypothetical protein SAMN02745123_00951 [Desulforamulus aeronauticus DSM 10349]|uniref:Uncharacterized protein n=1 Tax=Desulforamulus aeronauticus DSM 10349 TaxID=1121421 RepID=A0A1M6QC15_9FIRM|nr:hypothetical protein SAMN02745123_00951 [Desulforamulus aeronauticus DSM 10349]
MLRKVLNFFYNRRWELIFSTQDMQKYFSIRGKLMNNGIPSRTDFIDPSRKSSGRGGYAHNLIVTYNIYVRVNVIHRANEIIFHDK